MNFLAPLFLLGTLTLVMPVLFHLVKRSQQKKIPFSSLLFLTTTPPRITRRSRLEHLLLLLMRCLIICLLVAGFTRPYFRKAWEPPVIAQAGKNVVVLVDASASMRRANLWTLAQDKVRAVLKDLSAGDMAALYTYDIHLHPVVSFDDWKQMPSADRAELSVQLFKKETPHWAAGNLGPALIEASEIMQNRLRADPQSDSHMLHEIVLISDMQEGSHLYGLQEYDWPKNTSVRLEIVPSNRIRNASIQWLSDREGEDVSNMKSSVRLRVVNGIDSIKEQFVLWWDFGNAAGLKVDPLEVYVPAGQSKIVHFPFTAGSSTGERIRLSGDAEEYDNQLFVVVSEIEKLTVSYFGDELDTDSQRPLYYLQRAVRSMEKRLVKLVRPSTNDTLNTEIFESQLSFVTAPLTETHREHIKNNLKQGKTVILVLSSTRMLDELRGISGKNISVEESKGSEYTMLSHIDFTHPIFAPFSDPRYNDFTKIRFWKHRQVDLRSIPEALVISRFEDNTPFLIHIPVESGAILVLASSWHPEDSQLAVSSKFLPLLASIMDMSLKTKPVRLQYRVGEEIPIPRESIRGSVTMNRPDGSRIEVASDDQHFRQTDLPGIYSMVSSVLTQRFAVNLPAEESRMTAILPDDLKQLGVPIDIISDWKARRGNDVQRDRKAEEMEAQQNLWRWLILGALILLLLETFASGWFARRPANQVT